MHNETWGFMVTSAGMLGFVLLTIVKNYPEIVEGDILAILEIPLILIVAYILIFYFWESLKDRSKKHITHHSTRRS